ncbi:unnamed protein product [Phaedon cochleariae]|uniref:Laminin IV type A domain-containing protein n=1 Tax=Phaedon cochleariae TaxID=80249 RepID=A0A9N9SMA9_PHACE|nr:unnamed protein product [Phaedon cochleariae]
MRQNDSGMFCLGCRNHELGGWIELYFPYVGLLTELGHKPVNVEGKYCDRCKSGHFGLRSDIAEGCLPCYCSGVTTLCESAIVKPKKIESLQDWLITDLQVTKSIKPNWNGQGVFSLGTAEFPGIKSLYWLAPPHYAGNKLTAYNADFVFRVQWVVMRGDTSGEPTRGPNMVIIGQRKFLISIRIGSFRVIDSMEVQETPQHNIILH